MSSAERGWWSVCLLLDEQEAGPISGAMEWAISDDVRSVRVSDLFSDPAGPASFAVELRASTRALAEERAQSIAAQIRRGLKLPERMLELAWVAPLAGDGDSLRFLEAAQELLETEHPDLAVVAAQIHLEIQIKTLLGRAPGAGSAWARRILNHRSIGNPQDPVCQGAIELLLGVDPTSFDDWPQLAAHILRRNAVVHHGQTISPDDAAASIDLVRRFWIWLTESQGPSG